MEDGATSDAPPPLNVTDTAARLGLSKDKVRQLIIDGELEADAVSGAYRVSVDAIERFEQRRDAPAGEDRPPADATPMISTDGLPVMFTVEETAAYLGLPVPTVRKALRDGQIPNVTIGSRRYVPTAQLVAWLAGAA